MPEATAASPKEHQKTESGLARNALNLPELVFTAMAALAPLTLVAAVMPLHFFVGGAAVPGGYLVAAVVMGLFAVGLTTTMRYVRNTGAFYAIITRGLGKEAGSAAALLAVMAYNALQISTYGALGLYAGDVANRLFGVHAPWWLYAAVALAVVGVLGYRGITASAKVLSIVLALEMVALTVLAVAIFIDGGPSGFSSEPFSPSAVLDPGNGAMYGLIFGAFMGFESTVIYSEETSGGARTVRRATYVVVAVIGLFYAVMAFAVVTAYGADDIAGAAGDSPADLVLTLFDRYSVSWFGEVVTLLLLLSAFAALLALHNASNRYTYALGRELLVPPVFGRTHPATKSPWVAGVAQCGLAAVVLAVCAVLDVDPYLGLLLWGSALGFLGMIALWSMCALAIVAHMRRHHPGAGLWRTLVAPLLSALALAGIFVLVVVHFDLFSGGTPVVNTVLFVVAASSVVGGLARALYLRARAPRVYERLGTTNAASDDDTGDADTGTPKG
ncbi:APC family permease [Streptomyces sulphureus]|uniref:APC family permease n=1 Tax=Streptomyces sulphureus TaxID=47758 RepID=UPI00037BF2DB|nr:APC family permease [Streptomyces sulphureus]